MPPSHLRRGTGVPARWVGWLIVGVIVMAAPLISLASKADERRAQECAARGGQIVRGGYANRSTWCEVPGAAASAASQ